MSRLADLNSRSTKRVDIQGLRAVAVSLVVLEHLFGRPVGGFIGVDVFFVISGFLIIGLLLDERARTGRLSLKSFYLRRVRRLMPAAIVVLAATLLAAFTLLPSVRASGIATDALWSVLFVANWHFAFQDTDYFASGSPVSPLQHFWSLSVEEQFYLVVPMLLALALSMGTSAAGRRLALAVVATLTVASATWAIVATADDPSASYFSSTVRAWELGVGGLIAFGTPLWRRMRAGVGTALGWTGIVVIGSSSVLVNGESLFPAPLAAIPVAGATMVLMGGSAPGATPPVILRTRPVVAIGNVSYSLYLWHFPVFVVITSIDERAAWIALPLSFALAFVTYHLIEQPALRWTPKRRSRSARRGRGPQQGVKLSAVGGLLIIAVVLALVAGDRLRPIDAPPVIAAPEQTTPPQASAHDQGRADRDTPGPASTTLTKEITDSLAMTSWPSLDQDPGGTLAGGEHLECGDVTAGLPVDDCSFGPADAEQTMMLVGDSTAVHELDAFVQIVEHETSDWRVVSRAGFACSFMDVDLKSDDPGACQDYREDTLKLIDEIRPDVLVVTNSFADLALAKENRNVTTAEWSSGLINYLERSTRAVGKIVFVAPPPTTQSVQACYRPGDSPAACISRPNPEWRDRFAAVQDAVEGKGLAIDTRPIFCVQDACPAFVGTTVVKKDYVHLTGAYAKKMAPALYERLQAADVLG